MGGLDILRVPEVIDLGKGEPGAGQARAYTHTGCVSF